MSDKKYVGSGKKVGQYDMVNVSICIDQAMPHFFEYQGKTYLKVTVGAKRQVDQYGKTHSVWVDEFEPQKQGDAPDVQAEDGSNLPPQDERTIQYPTDEINPDDIPF